MMLKSFRSSDRHTSTGKLSNPIPESTRLFLKPEEFSEQFEMTINTHVEGAYAVEVFLATSLETPGR